MKLMLFPRTSELWCSQLPRVARIAAQLMLAGLAFAAKLDAQEVVELPTQQWSAARIELQPATRSSFTNKIELTGKIALNQDRIAHIYPMVEGTVESVPVSLGQSVSANTLLAVVHSREIGEAKLRLYQANLHSEIAQVKHDLQLEISQNSRALIGALRDKTPIEDIEPLFRNRPMGDYRERVLAAYSNFLKSQADVSRLSNLVESGAVSGKQLLTAEANRNADQATFQSRIEQIDYELQTSTLLSSQAVKEAQTQVAVASTTLRILGCEADMLNEIDLTEQGETISHYSIRAPFSGTVVSKDVVLREQVRPDDMLFSIADLSTVWVTTDIYEEHVPLLETLAGQKVTIRVAVYPEQTFEADVFYTGEIMDEATRTIAMRAIANNPNRMLKPGMFVTVEFPVHNESDALQIPLSAIQEHEGQKFVFVHDDGGRFERRNIQVGETNQDSLIVLDGLQLGESVVTKGGFILKSRLLASLLGEE